MPPALENEPSNLGGTTVRLKVNSVNPAVYRDVNLDSRPLGSGSDAFVYGAKLSRGSRELGLEPETALAVRVTREHESINKRRLAALQALMRLQRQDRAALAGMVPIFGYGVVERVDRHRVQDTTLYFDLMADAGESLYSLVTRDQDGNRRWTLRHEESVLALLPAAAALARLHRISRNETAVTAHRDIKPSNMLVLWPGSREYAKAVTGLPDGAVPGHLIPLVRIGDLGAVRQIGTEAGATGTATPHSDLWSAPEAYMQRTVSDPRLLDVWSFGATLFYVLTGHHAWSAFDSPRTLYSGEIPIVALRPPDSASFGELPAPLADLIRTCLDPEPAARPAMDAVVARLEAFAPEAEVFREADTPTVTVALVPRPAESLPLAASSATSGRLPFGAAVRQSLADPGIKFWLKALTWSVVALAAWASVVLLLGLINNSLAGTPPKAALGTGPSTAAAATASGAPPPARTVATPSPPGVDRAARDKDVVNQIKKDLAAPFTIGPLTNALQIDILKGPLTDLGWADRWAQGLSSSGAITVNNISLSGVNGGEQFLHAPSYVLALHSIENLSSKTLTFDLANCSPKNPPNTSGAGPSLMVTGPVPGDGTYAGYRHKEIAAPFLVLPACSESLSTWPAPVTVEAGKTWTAPTGAYRLVFEMPPDTDPAKYRMSGFLLKSREGAVAFTNLPTSAESSRLHQPAG